jgi:hypothetical protein
VAGNAVNLSRNALVLKGLQVQAPPSRRRLIDVIEKPFGLHAITFYPCFPEQNRHIKPLLP